MPTQAPRQPVVWLTYDVRQNFDDALRSSALPFPAPCLAGTGLYCRLVLDDLRRVLVFVRREGFERPRLKRSASSVLPGRWNLRCGASWHTSLSVVRVDVLSPVGARSFRRMGIRLDRRLANA